MICNKRLVILKQRVISGLYSVWPQGCGGKPSGPSPTLGDFQRRRDLRPGTGTGREALPGKGGAPGAAGLGAQRYSAWAALGTGIELQEILAF